MIGYVGRGVEDFIILSFLRFIIWKKMSIDFLNLSLDDMIFFFNFRNLSGRM